MVNMTVFTIVYNGYGKYLNNWLKCVYKQTLPPKEILVVLGKNHGVTEKPDGITFIECDSDVMGVLRNVGIRNKRYKKCLYFGVDDELLPNAIDRIEAKFHQGFKVVGLRYNDLKEMGTKEVNGKLTPLYVGMVRDSYILDGQKRPDGWQSSGVPGWVAVNGSYEYEEIDIPNYPYIFKLRSLNLPMALTDEVVANYIRRRGSHGDRAEKLDIFKDYVTEINSWVGKWQYTGI